MNISKIFYFIDNAYDYCLFEDGKCVFMGLISILSFIFEIIIIIVKFIIFEPIDVWLLCRMFIVFTILQIIPLIFYSNYLKIKKENKCE